jgi:hypothetical protein
VIAELTDRPATRDELVRYVADKLDVDRDYLMIQLSAPPTRERPQRTPAPERPQLDALARAERAFLAMCVGSETGRELFEGLKPDHFTSEPLRRVRDHLEAHWEDPLAGLPEDDPMLAALIKDVAMRADEEAVSAEVLRLTFLQLELRRVERALRHAEREGDFQSQRTLASGRQALRDQIDDLMGLTL